jgi:hypothetical protein
MSKVIYHFDWLAPYFDKIFKKTSCSMLLSTKVGIKPINKLFLSEYCDEIILETLPSLNIEKIVAHPDFLKDAYTLIGTTVSEWPHYELIKCIDGNLPLDTCDYVTRSRNGTLDFRKKMRVPVKSLKEYFQNRYREMKEGKTFTIKIYHVFEDIYTVADGKHSLAMAYYYNYSNLRFEVIRNLLFDTYYRWIFEQIKKTKDYSKHIDFFRRAYEVRKGEIDRICESRSSGGPD